MKSFGWLACIAALALVPASGVAAAQFFDNDIPLVTAKYRSGNTIRATALLGPRGDPREARDGALHRIAEMAEDKGYERIAVVKVSDCGTLLVNNRPSYVSCRLLARMVKPGEVAKPEGGNPVTYFRTADVLAGRTVPEAKDDAPAAP